MISAAGSTSSFVNPLCISLLYLSEKMLVGFARYSRDRSFTSLAENCRFVPVMAAGSIFGSFIGGAAARKRTRRYFVSKAAGTGSRARYWQ